ncbi:hypothetical protein [Candidatus Albibeggiatoa sp. nov. BB20]|uniref:maleate cis-trans isomerase family protein n=1 Tax=Candidatus Albibeggiatoa sp. nov. BB20 TaxID=3162723 RepID=UPI0033654D69
MSWNRAVCEMDNGPASRAAIGLLALSSDTVSEPEVSAFLPQQGIGFYTSRVPMSDIATVESLASMKPSIKAAADLLVPSDNIDVIAYGCTAAAILIGSDNIKQTIQATRKTPVAYSDPMLAGLTALRTLNCQRIVLLTPYIDDVGDVVSTHFEQQNITVVDKASFKKSGDPEIARISPHSIYQAAVNLAQDKEIDALFISCTALRVFDVLESIEQKIGKPVISSNQALAWHCLRLAGDNSILENRGQLFRTALA